MYGDISDEISIQFNNSTLIEMESKGNFQNSYHSSIVLRALFKGSVLFLLS